MRNTKPRFTVQVLNSEFQALASATVRARDASEALSVYRADKCPALGAIESTLSHWNYTLKQYVGAYGTATLNGAPVALQALMQNAPV